MFIKQISVFIENKSGRLFRIADALGRENVNIRSLSMADTSDFGIIRLIVDQPDKASQILKSNGFSVGITSVLAIEVPDASGGLASILKHMDESGLNVEYMYAFVEKSKDNAVVIFKFENTEAAVKMLISSGVRILSEKEVLSL